MVKSIKNKKFIFCLIVLGILATSSVTLALQVDWPASPGFGTKLTGKSELPELIKYFYEWGITLGGLAVFIVLIIAGFQYLTSVGNPTAMKEAMDRIKSAFFGLVLLLSSWLILNTINPELTTFKPLVMPGPTIFGNCEKGEIYKDEYGIEHERKGDEFCEYHFGDDYECKNDVCTIDLTKLFEVKDCEEVAIKIEKEDGRIVPVTLPSPGAHKYVEITPADKIFVKAKPKNCMATLVLQAKKGPWGGCGGDKRSFALQPGTVSYPSKEVSYDELEPILLKADLDIAILCVKLEKI